MENSELPFFADLKDEQKKIVSNEGNLEWFYIERLLKNPPEMPFTAQYVVQHYAEIGKKRMCYMQG